MYGTDHMEPPPETARAIAYTRGKLNGDILIHSTLPAYIAAVQKSLRKTHYSLPVVTGELRQCKRSHLLPGVLSTRMWIKQRNRACETLLEKWAEPFSTFASWNVGKLAGLNVQTFQRSNLPTFQHISNPAPIVRQAWHLLMECHPHDSICGCSIDQVHDEMKVRFDQVDQIGEEITHQSLETLAASINTASNICHSSPAAIVIFNPTTGPRTDLVTARAGCKGEFEIVDEQGEAIPYQMFGSSSQDLINAVMSKRELKSGLAMIHEGRILGKVIHEVAIQREGSQVQLEVVLADSGQLDLAAWEKGMSEIEALLADPTVTTFHARAYSTPAAEFVLLAKDVPGHGYRTFWLRPLPASLIQPVKVGTLARLLMPLASLMARLPFLERLLGRPKAARPPFVIENEYLHVEASPADGTLTVKDKRTGTVYCGLNQFVDGGDCGDEYNYSPPPSDFQPAARLKHVFLASGPVRQTLSIELDLPTPASLAPDRKSRSKEMTVIHIASHITLTAGVPRVDIRTEVENHARDHRLRVHFPTPFAVTEADYDSHFEVIRRPIGLPEFDETWIEQPRPEVPQRAFTVISDGKIGLMIANRGLPEVEVMRNPFSQRKRVSENGVEIALTLLRCINWISRDDFEGRRGHAGPMTSAPGAQMIGRWEFDYSIIPVGQDAILSYNQAYAFEAPLRAVSTGLHDGTLPASGSFVEVSPHEFVISAVKEAEDGKGWLVRGYNTSGKEINVTLKSWRKCRRVARVNLAEEKMSALRPASDGRVEFTARAHEIVTIMWND